MEQRARSACIEGNPCRGQSGYLAVQVSSDKPVSMVLKSPIGHNITRIYRHMICNAKDLSADQKAAIETLLGRRFQEGEVRAFEPAAVPHDRKREIADELRRYFAEVDASRPPVSEEEAEDIITEAMRSVRPGYRPHP
jgi:hypothetical protein